MPACLALPPLPQPLLGAASPVYGEFALNSSISSWQTALNVDELSVLRFHVAPIDVDVDATVLHARDGAVATSARDGVGHEELLLLPLVAANKYTLLLRFSGAQRCGSRRHSPLRGSCEADCWSSTRPAPPSRRTRSSTLCRSRRTVR